MGRTDPERAPSKPGAYVGDALARRVDRGAYVLDRRGAGHDPEHPEGDEVADQVVGGGDEGDDPGRGRSAVSRRAASARARSAGVPSTTRSHPSIVTTWTAFGPRAFPRSPRHLDHAVWPPGRRGRAPSRRRRPRWPPRGVGVHDRLPSESGPESGLTQRTRLADQVVHPSRPGNSTSGDDQGGGPDPGRNLCNASGRQALRVTGGILAIRYSAVHGQPGAGRIVCDWLTGGKLRLCWVRCGGHRHVPFHLSRMSKQPDPLPGLV